MSDFNVALLPYGYFLDVPRSLPYDTLHKAAPVLNVMGWRRMVPKNYEVVPRLRSGYLFSMGKAKSVNGGLGASKRTVDLWMNSAFLLVFTENGVPVRDSKQLHSRAVELGKYIDTKVDARIIIYQQSMQAFRFRPAAVMWATEKLPTPCPLFDEERRAYFKDYQE